MRITCESPQATLRESIELRGTGVFTGQPCAVTIQAAPVNHGLVFEAIDAAGSRFSIPVHPANLVAGPNRSTLAAPAHPTQQINMVEHVLSALHGLGIDNALIRVTGGECPLGDGSALPVVEAILRDGVELQDAPRIAIRVTESQEFTQGEASLRIDPPESDVLMIDYTLDYGESLIGRARVRWTITPELYARQIGPARTFIPIAEAEALVQQGILQSTESDCLVVYPDRTNHPLRIPEEFAAHKVLDCIGDLRLCGWPVLANVTGVRSGHALNQQAARWLAATQS